MNNVSSLASNFILIKGTVVGAEAGDLHIAVVSVACMPVGHGAWKASEPLSDPDQLLSIAKHDPNVNAKQVVGVCNTQQRLVYPLPHTSYTRSPSLQSTRCHHHGGAMADDEQPSKNPK